MLTPSETKTLKFIQKYCIENGCSPTLTEIADGIIPDPANMMLDPEGSGGILPLPMPEEEPQPDVADAPLRSTAVDSAVTKSNINQTPKGGEI